VSLYLRDVRLAVDVTHAAGDSVDLRIDHVVITEIGAPGSFRPRADDEVRLLAGRWISPGLWDNHVHFDQWAMRSQRVDLERSRSAAETARIVGESLLASPPVPGQPLIGVGFRDGLWPDAPSLVVLDAVSGSTPVVLISADVHAVWVNSAAIALYGLDADADTHTDTDTHNGGLFRETQAFEIQRRCTTTSLETIDGWAFQATSEAAQRGVVGIVDLEMGGSVDSWQRRSANGGGSLRVECGVYPQYLDEIIGRGLRGGQQLNELISVGPLKVITDGSLNTRTAYCFDAYEGLTGAHDHGLSTVTLGELVPLMRRGVDAGFRPAVHAIGDHANTMALDAFEEIGCRGSIEHAQLLTWSDLPRFAALGVTASVQPEHALDDRDVADHFWAGRTDRAFMLRSLLDAGARLALGSDAPVAPLDPWVAMAAAVGRTREGREPWHPEQSITAAEALAASVRTSVSVGQVADLVVTDLDPRSATAAQLRTMPVSATLLAGNFTHDWL
jgi:predicted amidohydrolase YtcJ